MLLAGGLSLWLPLRATASPLEDPTLGGAVFTGPVHPHATALFLNPGALGLAGRGTHLYLDTSLRFDRYAIDRQRITMGPDSSPVSVRDFTLSPSGTLAWYNVGRTISVGAALSMVTVEKLLDEDFAADQTTPIELGYYTLGGSHSQYAWRELGPVDVPIPMPTLAGSYRVNQRFIFGIGISLRFSTMSQSFLRDTALEGGTEGISGDCNGQPCGIENPAAAERYDIEVDTPTLLAAKNLVLGAGAMYQVARDWWIGLQYQSPPGFLSSLSATGTACITPASRDAMLDIDRPGCPPGQLPVRAEIIYDLPQVVSGGVRGPVLGSYDMFAAVTWQNLSQHRMLDLRLLVPQSQPVTIPERYPRYRGFNDVVVIEGGLEQREGGRGRVGARLRLETASTSENAISPAHVDSLNFTVAVGGEIRLTQSLVLSGSYGFTLYQDANVSADESLYDPRERLSCVDSGYNVDLCEAAIEGRALPSGAGSYGHTRHALRLAVQYHFVTF